MRRIADRQLLAVTRLYAIDSQIAKAAVSRTDLFVDLQVPTGGTKPRAAILNG
jgi:hypothetical protein